MLCHPGERLDNRVVGSAVVGERIGKNLGPKVMGSLEISYLLPKPQIWQLKLWKTGGRMRVAMG